MLRHGVRSLIAALALTCFVAAGSATAQAPPNDLVAAFKQNEKDCKAAVSADMAGHMTVDGAVTALWKETGDGPTGPCKAPPLQGAQPVKVLEALETDLSKRWGRYGCDETLTAACEGLVQARARLTSIRLALGDDHAAAKAALESETLDYEGSLHWRRYQLSFGDSPATGVSLLKLVLKATPARTESVTAFVTPKTRYDIEFPPQFPASVAQKPCDDLCVVGVAQVVALYPVFRALDYASQPTAAKSLKVVVDELEGRRDRWDAYHFGGGTKRVQLPWELALNSILYTPPPVDEVPFPKPPTTAWILLHPSVGLTLKDSKGEDGKVVGVVELLGKSWWRYNEKNERAGELGASVIAAYRPRDDGDDWGYGVLVRLPWQGLNVAWTRTDMKVGHAANSILFSVDVGALLPSLDFACQFKLPTCKTN